MRILIATGIFPPDIGGPAKYASELSQEFARRGHAVRVISFSTLKGLPPGIRHGVYFLKVFSAVRSFDLVLALDTFSAGFPALCAARLLRKKYVIRIGGDFLWESYTERAAAKITLQAFYKQMPVLSLKERFFFFTMKMLSRKADALVFNTAWQKRIFCGVYGVPAQKASVIENYYPQKAVMAQEPEQRPGKKVFLWAGRRVKWKNVDVLTRAFEKASRVNPDIALETISSAPSEELEKKFRTCWAIVLPSITEVGSNTIIEALAFNVPFILTRESGLSDRIAELGLFVDPLSEKDLTDKILLLADDARHREYVNKVANFRFTHSWEEIADEFLAIFAKV